MAQEDSTTRAFRRALSDFDMLRQDETVLAAVSGGQDSVALLDLLCQISAQMDLQIVAAHYNHLLRPAADEDQKFVKKLAQEKGCEVVTGRGDVETYASEEGMNLEAAARKLRYRFLENMADEIGADRIALGHTASDLAETLMMNVLRGAGMRGLASIPPTRGRIIRPLVYVTREQTAEYCANRELSFRTDPTNLDTDYTRNRIRLELLPDLEDEYGPGVVEALTRTALAARQELEWTEPQVAEAWERCRPDTAAVETLLVPEAQELARGLLVRVLRKMCRAAGLEVRQMQWEHWTGMADLLSDESGTGRISLPGDWRARREYDKFMLERPRNILPDCGAFDIMLKIPGTTELPGSRIVQIHKEDTVPDNFPGATQPEAVLDANRAGSKLRVRTLEPGDTFVPLGMDGTKKISEFFIDEKVPARKRRRAAAVVNADDRILWLIGHRISQLAAVTEDTNEVYHVRILEGPRTDRMR